MWCKGCNSAVTYYLSDDLCEQCYKIYKDEISRKIYPPGFLADISEMTELEWLGFRGLSDKAESEGWSKGKLQEEVQKLTEDYNKSRCSSTKEAQEQRQRERQKQLAKIRNSRPY